MKLEKKKKKRLAAGALIAAAALATAATALGQEAANYTVTFARTWTAATHPFEYPEASLVSGPHFSGLIGASHGEAYDLFKEGTPPTPGLEKLSEEGKHSPLDKEIQAAIRSGKAGALFETGPIKDESKTETTKVHVSDRFPIVSAVAMIAPSPDWFAGVSHVSLKEGGRWVQTKTVELHPLDSGGDDGVTYKAPDKNTNPKKKTMKASTRHFVTNGKTAPVGTLTFTLQP